MRIYKAIYAIVPLLSTQQQQQLIDRFYWVKINQDASIGHSEKYN